LIRHRPAMRGGPHRHAPAKTSPASYRLDRAGRRRHARRGAHRRSAAAERSQNLARGARPAALASWNVTRVAAHRSDPSCAFRAEPRALLVPPPLSPRTRNRGSFVADGDLPSGGAGLHSARRRQRHQSAGVPPLADHQASDCSADLQRRDLHYVVVNYRVAQRRALTAQGSCPDRI